MNDFVKRMAFKYRDNTLAKIFIRPVYRIIEKQEIKKRRKLFLRNGLILLEKVKQCLDSENILFWLEFGTLLGAYREHDFIAHDFDIDIGVFYEDAIKVTNALLKGGLQLQREIEVKPPFFKGLEQTYYYKGVSIDIFYFHKEQNSMFCNTFSPFTDEHENRFICQVKKIIVPYNGFESIKFKNIELTIPAKTNMHLAAHYGKNFMVPNALFDYKKEASNIYWYPRKECIGMLIEHKVR